MLQDESFRTLLACLATTISFGDYLGIIPPPPVNAGLKLHLPIFFLASLVVFLFLHLIIKLPSPDQPALQ